jgi:hypothetical protein
VAGPEKNLWPTGFARGPPRPPGEDALVGVAGERAGADGRIANPLTGLLSADSPVPQIPQHGPAVQSYRHLRATTCTPIRIYGLQTAGIQYQPLPGSGILIAPARES